MSLKNESKLQFGNITDKNLKQLEILNCSYLPVQYKESFYQKILDLYSDYTFLAYFNDYVVGAISARKEPRFDEESCYILTFGVLQQYRRNGFAKQIMQELERKIKLDLSIKAIYLHVQTSNISALEFYKKIGFEIIEKVDNYYTDVQPDSAFFLKKLL